MKKIVSLFQRNYDGDRLVRDEIVPGAEWVANGEGVATRKYDGTCCMVRGGVLFKRYDAKRGKEPPYGFIAAQEPDPVTGHWPGWIEVGNGSEDRWFRDACPKWPICDKPDGTYELCGPKVQGNPERLATHCLIRHGAALVNDAPRDFVSLRSFLSDGRIEGIVWHHPDGRMVKIKAKDFGIKRQAAKSVPHTESPASNPA